MRKYVHRVGRTARAGRTGDAWTLVEEQEVIASIFTTKSYLFADEMTGRLGTSRT